VNFPGLSTQMKLGFAVGLEDGAFDGMLDFDGVGDGALVGVIVGPSVGFRVGFFVGLLLNVGAGLGLFRHVRQVALHLNLVGYFPHLRSIFDVIFFAQLQDLTDPFSSLKVPLSSEQYGHVPQVCGQFCETSMILQRGVVR